MEYGRGTVICGTSLARLQCVLQGCECVPGDAKEERPNSRRRAHHAGGPTACDEEDRTALRRGDEARTMTRRGRRARVRVPLQESRPRQPTAAHSSPQQPCTWLREGG